MRAIQALAHDIDLCRREAGGRDHLVAVSVQEQFENRVGPLIADAEIAFVGLAGDQVGGGGLRR